MEAIEKLEKQILDWIKGVPHLPESARKWLGTNIWWIALVGGIISGIAVLVSFIGLLGIVSLVGTVGATYYAAATFTTWSIVTGLVSLAFGVLQTIILIVAVKPLQDKQKKGWVLLFAAWLVGILATVITAILTLNPIAIIFNLLFGAIWVAISGYFLFEIHGQFAHVQKSRGVKAAESKEK